MSTMEKPDAQQQTSSQDKSSGNGAKKNNGAVKDPPASKKPFLPMRLWTASGLDSMTLILMFKGAVAPTVALAIYQADAIAEIYSTLGYLVAIMSVLSMPIMPRSKFIQNIFLNLIGICIGSCIALLTIYCSVQARKHTTPVVNSTATGAPISGAVVTGYNSSASAVCAIWLFANIYVVNTLRASRPQLQLPVIMYSIFAVVASIYAPSFPTMAAGIAFVKRLIEAFTLAFGLSTAVNFLIFPITCRSIFFQQSAGMVAILQSTLQAQKEYIQTMEKDDMFKDPTSVDTIDANDEQNDKKEVSDQHRHFQHEKKLEPKPRESPQAAKMKAMIAAMGKLQGETYADISFAKREVGYGKLDAHAIETMNHHFRQIMLPLYGMSSVADIFGRVAQKRGWAGGPDSERMAAATKEDPNHEMKRAKIKQWNEIMKTLHEPFDTMTTVMCESLEHISLALELTKPSKPSKKSKSADNSKDDVEANAGIVRPGDPKYSEHLKQKIDVFYEQRRATLTSFMKQVGVYGDEDYFTSPAEAIDATRRISMVGGEQSETHKRNQRQLYMVLYMEFLLWSTGRAILRFVEYADEKVDDGTMKKNRIINPRRRRLQKWFTGLLKKEDMSSTEYTPDAAESGSAGVYMGASFQTKLDPEHLPPANSWERFTAGFRNIPRVLGSMESAFGFRVACATLTIGIVAFLERSEAFFLEQRLVWAMVMVAIGMTITAGAGVFGFIGRIAGTFIAMCTSLVIWYIVDGHTAGVIVFFFVFTFIEFYCLIKFPKIMVVVILSIVTQVLIVGYELEVQKVGIKTATGNGQPYYQIYLLAPYRLATVAGGMLVAFFWTFFPYPLTERSQLRKDLGSALYLLANFYSVVHTSVGIRVQGKEGDLNDKESPGHKLDKARGSIWEKEMALIGSLRQHSAFTVWEPAFGGKFPKQTYDAIIGRVSSLVNYLSLISYASQRFSQDSPKENEEGNDKQHWINDFSHLVGSLNPTSQEITSTLVLLSGAVAQASPLPPYLKVPDAYMLSARLEMLDKDILSIDHVLEPGYSAFAVMQIATSLVRDDMSELIEHVKKLVGEVDFSFHIHTSASSSEETLYEKDGQKGKKD